MADPNTPSAVPDEPRGYSVVEIPPVLPLVYETDAFGNSTRTIAHWATYCADYTTRRNAGGYFESRLINPDDPTGEGKFSPNDWPMEMRLGPPSKLPDFHPLIEKYGLQVLEAAGFVNQLIPPEYTNTGPVGLLHYESWRNPLASREERIHPVLRFDTWRGTAPLVYANLRPAVLLASAILDDPKTLNYFYALSEPMAVYNDPRFATPCHVMTPPASLTPAQMQETYNRICAMRAWTTWGWEAAAVGDYGRWGMCASRIDPITHTYVEASGPHTHQSDIYLNDMFVNGLYEFGQGARNGDTSYHSLQVMAGIPLDRRIEIRSESVLFRTTVGLAITMLHEFVHAFAKAYYPKPNVSQRPWEPWLAGKRANEQGSSFEDYIFGGNLQSTIISMPPISMTFEGKQVCSPPFGFWFEENFDQCLVNHPDNPSDVFDHIRPIQKHVPRKLWPVPQEWSHRLFTDAMWNDQVKRFGNRAYRLPRPDNWAIFLWADEGPGMFGTGQERWNMDPPLQLSFRPWA